MAGLGANGAITTYPGSGEKLCASCEYWQGRRQATAYGGAATTADGKPAFCPMKKMNVYPGDVCRCMPSKYQKWSHLK